MYDKIAFYLLFKYSYILFRNNYFIVKYKKNLLQRIFLYLLFALLYFANGLIQNKASLKTTSKLYDVFGPPRIMTEFLFLCHRESTIIVVVSKTFSTKKSFVGIMIKYF